MKPSSLAVITAVAALCAGILVLFTDIELSFVRWGQGAAAVERHFPYGLTRADVEAAILAGP